MAFVRWRGNTADLPTDVCDGGRRRQVRPAGLGGRYVQTSTHLLLCIAKRFSLKELAKTP